MHKYRSTINEGNKKSYPPLTEQYKGKPGKCLIINNMDFKRLPALVTSIKDEEILQLLFIGLGFKVDIRRNLTAKEMISIAREYGKMEHTGAFVLVVLSYGELQSTSVYGTDGEIVQVTSNLEKYFKEDRCPSLIEVPKLFLFDTCSLSPQEKVALDHSHHLSSLTSQPNHAIDSTFIFACCSRQKVLSNPYYGKELIRALKAAIDEMDENGSIGTIVKHIERHLPQQCIQVEHLLRGKYFIKRNTHLNNVQKYYKLHEQLLQEWLMIRETTMQTIDKIVEQLIELNKDQENIKKAQRVGGVAIAGGAMVGLVALGLAPVTFGGSLLVGAGAAVLSVGGGVTAAGAGLYGKELKKEVSVTKIKQQYEKDQMKLKRAIECGQKTQQSINNIMRKCGNIDVKLAGQFFAVSIGIAYRGTNIGLRGHEVSSRGNFTVGTVSLTAGGDGAASVSSIAGIAVNKLLIQIDIAEIISTAMNNKDEHANAIRQLKKLQEKLTSQRSIIENALVK